ncbi:hypothetical protein A3I53_01495 [Candidatus Curtissbacteria bacterium RIFCSPLOWO2_02_FULL_40_13b]|uniref:Uncharacterized protein n=2 Tax=Candidatus Curtissiibacteriota TaxID=1752717 RepID=A0A1F5HV40_9BACT|nr:MAG: hypothetical protein A3F45_03635 [Candidatus Curtissbacteria bacterium RIFCSPHIGHO2_12_FULL_41_17]OGE08034.1 MAG: hypothetical protein A3I53_01495 [Candidatus Curtissbacteria bacterium RIFCSPLOWO2_02_FULL_40_13b]
MGPERAIERKYHPYNAIVVMPYGSNLRENGQVRLSYWSAQTVHAAYHLWLKGLASRIVIPGETVFGEGRPATTDLMVRYLIHKGIPPTSIIPLFHLNNTIYQLKAVKQIKEKEEWRSLLVVGCHWHNDRVKDNLARIGLSADVVEVETALAKWHPQTERERLLKVPATERMTIKDQRLRNHPILRQLWLQELGTKIFGPRVVDLRDDTYAKSKLREFKKHSK